MSERLRPQPKFQGDKGYQGEASIKTPRKPKKGINSSAVRAEPRNGCWSNICRTFGVVKIFRIASERFRLNSWKYEQIIMICGIVRLRIGAP